MPEPIAMMKGLFRKLWFQALSIALLIIISVTLIGYYQAVQAHRYAHKAKQSNVQQSPVSTTVAIDKGQKYLKNSIKQVDPHQRLILDFLYRKFAIDTTFNAATNPISIDSTQLELQSIQRIAYPDRTVKDLGRYPNLINEAINCDHIPLPSDYSQRLQNQANEGVYYLTHVALSIQVTKELGCHVILADPLMKQAREQMTVMINDPKTPADLRYECIAFLQYMGFRQDIQKQWIDKIAAEQQTDGSWNSSNSTQVTTDHTTTLALWALLEYTKPNVPQEPLIRH